MRTPARLLVITSIVLSAGSVRATAQAPATSAPTMDSVKVQLIHQILTEARAVDLMLQMMESATPSQRAANPAIPAAFWDRFLSAARDRKGDLLDVFTQIYDRHFTADELRQLLAFYRTPVGRKFLAEQPAIAQEAMAAGQQWGQRIGFEIGQKMAAEAQKAP